MICNQIIYFIIKKKMNIQFFIMKFIFRQTINIVMQTCYELIKNPDENPMARLLAMRVNTNL